MSEPATPPPLSEIDRSKAQAFSDLEDILALRKHPAWSRYFLRRLRERLEPIEFDLLNKPMDAAELRAKQVERNTTREIANLLTTDEAGNRSIAGV